MLVMRHALSIVTLQGVKPSVAAGSLSRSGWVDKRARPGLETRLGLVGALLH
jgi:hypothetical protein